MSQLPDEFYLQFKQGSEGGGFAPTTKSFEYTIQRTKGGALQIAGAERAEGEFTFTDLPPKTLSAEEAGPYVEQLLTILRSIPAGGYGGEASIAWSGAGLEWSDGAPGGGEGSAGLAAQSTPTEDQKMQFQSAVKIVDQLIEKAQ
ncbi:hypothetical protein FB45DRAFT_934612 [Roridomyces roridus]|uniref:Uncharacterized protein n=1 Tax=Roridomyces roridus TaxID=1738132 RepID=A0AAD7FD23_9AGAR|nr:hypothetical protein FB45DRAFT_934612 [Roridomyces roridus]